MNQLFILFLTSCFFFTFSFAGWLWEVFLHVYLDHALVNRGVLYGPWLPIYGFGGVLILFLLRRFAKKPHHVFLMTMLIAGTIEFVTGTIPLGSLSDALVGLSGFPDSSKRFVCLKGLLLFGTGGLLILYLAAPKLNRWYQKLPGGFKTCALCQSGLLLSDSM